jgi:hypothetical protein
MLDDLGIKYNTDKSSKGHGYLNIYETYFQSLREKELNILEIGIFNGGSLKMWDEYFINSKIFGMDLYDKSNYNSDKIETIIANQADKKSLNKSFSNLPKMDIIIDDGGHTMKQQQVSFGCLFPYLKNNGIYVIEDLHTSYYKRKHKYNPDDAKETLWMLENFNENKIIDSSYIDAADANYLNKNILSCNIEKGETGRHSEIAFIIKS